MNIKILGIYAGRWLGVGIVFTTLFFSLLLHSSSTHYAPLLRHYILQDDAQTSYESLWPAAKEGSKTALQTLAELSAQGKDFFWLEKAASLNNLHAQLALADLSQGDDKIYWWRQAATNGHGPSQFELALLVDSTEERVRYLEQAALNEHAPAIIALSKYYYENHEVTNAIRWLRKAAAINASSSFQLARMLWQQGFEGEALEAFEHASQSQVDAQRYIDTIKNTSRQGIMSLANANVEKNEQCAQKIQFVAVSLNSAVQADSFIEQFENDQRLRSLPICIYPTIWLNTDELSCKLVEARNVCDLSKLSKERFVPSYTHLVFFLGEGKAYVQNGAMYLDEADTYSVFVHELAHFVGFVDEYAVSSSLAEQYCYHSMGPNLIVAQDTNLQESEKYLLWQVYHRELIAQEFALTEQTEEAKVNPNFIPPSLEIGPSRTCASLQMKSYKPTNMLSFMEYHDTQNIPPIYLLMWQELLEQNHGLIAIAEIFKENALAQNEQSAALYWESVY